MRHVIKGRIKKIQREIISKNKKGSYTVEAAFLFPIIIFLMAFLMNLSISWYCQVTQAASDISALQEMDSLKEFYKTEQTKNIIEEVTK